MLASSWRGGCVGSLQLIVRFSASRIQHFPLSEITSMSAVRPLEDRILIKPLEPETKTASGIFLPETAKDRPMQGKVVALGPGKMLDSGKRLTPSIKVGDTVVFGKYAGTEVEIKNAKHLIVRESELLGILG
jgi:chaperonin GroES